YADAARAASGSRLARVSRIPGAVSRRHDLVSRAAAVLGHLVRDILRLRYAGNPARHAALALRGLDADRTGHHGHGRRHRAPGQRPHPDAALGPRPADLLATWGDRGLPGDRGVLHPSVLLVKNRTRACREDPLSRRRGGAPSSSV